MRRILPMGRSRVPAAHEWRLWPKAVRCTERTPQAVMRCVRFRWHFGRHKTIRRDYQIVTYDAYRVDRWPPLKRWTQYAPIKTDPNPLPEYR